MSVKFIAALAPIMMVAACATVTRGSKTDFAVQSTPSGALVETSMGLGCPATPCSIAKVPRKSGFTVTVSKPGYKPNTSTVASASGLTRFTYWKHLLESRDDG